MLMRIIAGKHRGRILKSLEFKGTRPTIDRVKEAVMSSLQNDINGGVVLDLFAGTGSLGLEALSRHAKKAYLVDNNLKAIKLIEENNKALNEEAIILQYDYKQALNYFNEKQIKFDVIFLDPPYESDMAQYSLDLIAKYNLLNENGAIMYEHDKFNNKFTVPKGLRIYSSKKYGNVLVDYLTLDE